MTQGNDGAAQMQTKDQENLAWALDMLRDSLINATSAADRVRSRVFDSGATRRDERLPWWCLPLLREARDFVARYEQGRPQRWEGDVRDLRAALTIVDAGLEAARSPAHEGGERPTVHVDAPMIARLLCGDAVETAHCLLEPCEGLEEWKPDHTELLREAVSAIRHMRETLHGDPLHKMAGRTLANIQKALGDG